MERDNLIKTYFELQLMQREILTVLASRHNVVISQRHLRRILKRLRLTRRGKYSDILDTALFIEEQLRSSGRLHGYRWMYTKCKMAGLFVRKEDVRILLQILDPESVSLRQRRRLKRREYFVKGPNFLWHVDGYDKLKPYGLCISGCIDGYSRKIIWLNVYYTNNNPKVIAGYYMEGVMECNGCPTFLRADAGTENGLMGLLHERLHINENEDQEAEESIPGRYLVGRSSANQRIEAWWAMLKKESALFWIDLLETLKDEGSFDGSDLDKNLIQFCFSEIIQSELDDVKRVWNNHLMRPVRGSRMPNGRPVTLYSFPELYGSSDYIHELTEQAAEDCLQECTFRSQCPCNFEEVYHLSVIYMEENGWHRSDDPFDLLELYRKIRTEFLAALSAL